jgi:hypothetical protein
MENVTEASRLFPRKMQKDEKLGEVIDRIKGILKI